MQTRNFASTSNDFLKMPNCDYVPSIYKVKCFIYL